MKPPHYTEVLQEMVDSLGLAEVLDRLSDMSIDLAVNARDWLKDPNKEKDYRFIADQLHRLKILARR